MATNRQFKENRSTSFQDVSDLSKEDAQQQIELLREGIEFHDHKYYVQNDPVISDAVYDKLFARLQELEETFPEFASENSPTQRVGAAPLDELKRVEHTAPMLSLNAALEQDEFEEFCDFVQREARVEQPRFVLEPKFDGVSVEIVYVNGRFEYGATRGDGQRGEDISANLRTIGSMPLSIRGNGKPPKRLAVRGEAYLPREGFQHMNRERIERDDEPYANARNAAAGILRRLESQEVARYPLSIVFYDILQIDGEEYDTHWDELQQFAKWGLKTDSHTQRCSAREDVAAFHKQLAEQRDELSYEIDGIVIKLDDKSLWEQLGTRHRSPRWAMAWKFSPREEVTTLEEIVVQVGRTGKLTPVALLQPVDVGGVTVSRATLHNESEVQEKDVRPGDQVRIARAGDVIPEVIERIKVPGRKRNPPFKMPHECPVCGTNTVQEGAYHFCPAGLSCEPQLIGRIIHYGSRPALDIAQLGEATVRDLVKRGFVKNLADLYELTVDDLRQLEGFAEKSAQKLHEAIQKSRDCRFDRFLYGLGIRHVGERVARVLAEEFESLHALRKAGVEKLTRVTDIGPEIARSVRTFFDQPQNQEVLQRMQQLGVTVQDMPSKPKQQTLKDKTFVFTGELEHYTRSEAEQAVERLGGRATSSVSGQTDYVVVGEDPGSKRDEAQQTEAQIIDEGQFEKLLSG